MKASAPIIYDILFYTLSGIGVLSLWALLIPIQKGIRSLSSQTRLQFFGVLILGIATRLSLSPIGQAPVPDILASRLLLTNGLQNPHPIYGGGMSILGGISHQLWSGSINPSNWFHTQLFLACLAPALIWTITYQVSPRSYRESSSWFAGILAAIFPVHILFSAGAVEHISLTTFCLGAAAAWLGSVSLRLGRLERGFLGILAGLLAGFAVHLRPEVIPFAGILALGLLLWKPKKGRFFRWIGGLICLGLILWRLWELGEKEFDTAQRVLIPKSDFILWIGWRIGVSSVWMNPGKPYYNALANIFSTPFLVWQLFILGYFFLSRWKRWSLPLFWLALFLPICLRGSPLTDALRMQLPSMMLACVIFGIGATQLLEFRPKFSKILIPLLLANAIPLLRTASKPWVATKYLPILQEGAKQVPPNASIIVPRFNGYAQKEINLAGSMIPREYRVRKKALKEKDPLPDGEAWLWWPIQCTPNLVQSRIMKPPNQKACDRFKQCKLEMITEDYITGRTDTDWVLPEEGVRVGWYKIISCAEE